MSTKLSKPLLAISLMSSVVGMSATANGVGVGSDGHMTKPKLSDEIIVRAL
jgi:hypothetical protein